jgi:thymidylate synthase
MKQYKELLNDILLNGTKKSNRTGIDTYSITGAMFEHDLREGFPLLTTKFVSAKTGCYLWD